MRTHNIINNVKYGLILIVLAVTILPLVTALTPKACNAQLTTIVTPAQGHFSSSSYSPANNIGTLIQCMTLSTPPGANAQHGAVVKQKEFRINMEAIGNLTEIAPARGVIDLDISGLMNFTGGANEVKSLDQIIVHSYSFVLKRADNLTMLNEYTGFLDNVTVANNGKELIFEMHVFDQDKHSGKLSMHFFTENPIDSTDTFVKLTNDKNLVTRTYNNPINGAPFIAKGENVRGELDLNSF